MYLAGTLLSATARQTPPARRLLLPFLVPPAWALPWPVMPAAPPRLSESRFLRRLPLRPSRQDGGAGKVGEIIKPICGKTPKWVSVRWKGNGHRNTYRVGADGKHDLVFATNPGAEV